ncbi:transcriptional regulator [Acrocarpospora corrugata]|uniref:Transcriptional regulator n=2 Tax=Acrocarpospora corrugata TaxID=35763 RepID=A0A5M3VZ40_9ACTN|nr:transcriptional regulator [Acrocarpospora corrugata]
MTVASIARLAGVSAPTVSKVINGRAGVALDTRRRVEALLREHDYRRPEAVGPAAILEVVFTALESHLAIEIMRGVESVAREHELAVGFTEMRGRLAPGRGWLEQVLARRPAAVIAVYAGFSPQQQGLLDSSSIPLVALDPTGEPGHAIPSVGATNWSGGVAATRHLLDLGHRRIAKIGGPPAFLCARARLDGFRAAMDSAGAPVDPSLIRDGAFAFEDGLALGRELLALPDRPTAVFAGNDLQALGVYEAAREAGLNVPRDLSVVGFDDLEFTRWCGPPLTTVRQPLADMGATAAEIAIALAAGEQPAQSRVELATTLIVRASTAPPR